MFLDLEWYWWLAIIAALAILIPVKIKFMRQWSRRRQEQKREPRGKWGDDA